MKALSHKLMHAGRHGVNLPLRELCLSRMPKVHRRVDLRPDLQHIVIHLLPPI